MTMNESMKNKLASILGKMDEKMLESKLNAALEMLKNKSPEELAQKMKGFDKNELMTKLNEFDSKKLNELNIDKQDLREKFNSIDMNKVSQILGENSEEIMKKIRDILK